MEYHEPFETVPKFHDVYTVYQIPTHIIGTEQVEKYSFIYHLIYITLIYAAGNGEAYQMFIKQNSLNPTQQVEW